MPVPPRPIPARNNRSTTRSTQPRPGTSVPRKSAVSYEKSDWRDEISLLAGADRARSLPGHSCVKLVSGIRDEPVVEAVKGRREVDVDGLIADGKGRREKRATTATALGFDFIPNPCIVALPSDTIKRPSHLSTTSQAVTPLNIISSNLSTTPQTPALLIGQNNEDVADLEDEEWEYIGREGEIEEDDGDIIILGELELEHRPLVPATSISVVGQNQSKLGSKGVSYAEALNAKLCARAD